MHAPWQIKVGIRFSFDTLFIFDFDICVATEEKGPVKLIKQVKIAHSFLQSVSYQFHVIILSLPM